MKNLATLSLILLCAACGQRSIRIVGEDLPGDMTLIASDTTGDEQSGDRQLAGDPSGDRLGDNGRCEWTVEDWGACSAVCEGGAQMRAVQCICFDGSGGDAGDPEGWNAEDALCDSPKPPATQECNTEACIYVWMTDAAWGSCSAVCEGGTQTRDVWCEREWDGATVSDEMCNQGTEPPASQDCNTQACVYVWRTDAAWGSCSVACGGGTQTRAVWCEREWDGATVSDGLCNAGSKPTVSQGCNTQSCCSSAGTGWASGTFLAQYTIGDTCTDGTKCTGCGTPMTATRCRNHCAAVADQRNSNVTCLITGCGMDCRVFSGWGLSPEGTAPRWRCEPP